MPRRRVSLPTPDHRVTEAALEAMDADELRALIQEIIPWLDEPAHARLLNTLVDRAARNRSGWTPERPTDAVVNDIIAFADAAKRVGHADPADLFGIGVSSSEEVHPCHVVVVWNPFDWLHRNVAACSSGREGGRPRRGSR